MHAVFATCDPGWINYKNQTCVFYAPFADGASTWEGARRYCNDLEGNLISIRDALFQVFVSGQLMFQTLLDSSELIRWQKKPYSFSHSFCCSIYCCFLSLSVLSLHFLLFSAILHQKHCKASLPSITTGQLANKILIQFSLVLVHSTL